MCKKILVLVVIGMLFAGCKKNILSPLDDNHRTLEDIYKDPYFAEGILMNAYTRLPTNGYSFSEVATDDAVTNDKGSQLLYMATGAWSAANNPMDQWNNSYTAIMYVNLFLREVDSVNWFSTNKDLRVLFNDRLKGEAYGLRALFLLNLLQAHAGYSASGELLGVPIITEALEPNSDFSKQRNTFAECIQQIYTDLAEAEKYLPLDYANVGQVPSKYSGIKLEDYNRVFGNFNRQRVSARIVKAIRAKAALLAASPAYNPQGDMVKWEAAANYAGEVLKLNGGLNGLDPQGGLFYTANNVNPLNLETGVDQKEMLWRGSIVQSNNLEQNNFPPTLFGNGRVNPTQNLVDAFPMSNGYPISDPASGYVATDPYANRDPRLRNYILVNGRTISNKTIWTKTDNPTNDAVNVLPTSTRTGYYLRKLMREDVNLNPTSTSVQKHYPVHIRYTEIFLAYAEAANEAWGPEGTGSYGYSARDVIAAIRKRAGITQPDNYQVSITTKEGMRQLIRNERRLELSFEGFRFWDLRRWKENLTEQAKGVMITNNTYNVQPVENRQYSDFMYYGPITITEVMKANLQQNKGW
ncbi:RagB/SusD family nutrient uptake outer membrane protein [Chitinophagaceae bacterium LB-8]|uniref:RagB/SusD family nutrient uptake outer membrane protein n=1 Tax=Paraflavisolibacter caeni TaxID=2982496 RepID=A0A9X2Y0Q6_9BACT|nr:RagB/SusD family nutrient uptake outer membrane protein [Paraflavisolibacter caeni]MCU7552257.1 RagB/SusD family nutrient uptake outer membrane protein [Paraflavisolibacter caeni]